MINRVATKVHRVMMPCCHPVECDGGPALIGVSGSEGDAMRVIEWVKKGMLDDTRPQLPPDSLNAILVTEGGAFRLDSQLHPLKITEPFHAIGNGRDFAMAAMHLGHDAVAAVKVACVYDIYTSAPITSVTLDGPVTVHE